MKHKGILPRFGIYALALAATQGCGGSHSAVSPPPEKSGGAPTSATLSQVADILSGVNQGAICGSFTGYGARLLTRRQTVFDNTLGLWYTVLISTSILSESLYLDQAKTMPAGSLKYKANDVAQTLSGDFSITAGSLTGLAGTFLQANQALGSNGSITFSIPNVSTTNEQYELTPDGKGGYPSKATIGVALQDGYLMTELLATEADGSMVGSTTDSNALTTSFGVSSLFAGSGVIGGKAPGLPAKITWTSEGNGTVVFADGSSKAISGWKLAS